MKKVNINESKICAYLESNSDRPIYQVYNELKKKKLRQMSSEEILVYSYLKMNKRKLGIR